MWAQFKTLYIPLPFLIIENNKTLVQTDKSQTIYLNCIKKNMHLASSGID